MATRRQRQLKHRRRAVERRRKYFSHKFRAIGNALEGWHGGGKFWLYGNVRKQQPIGLVAGSVNPVPQTYAGTPPLPFTISAIGRALPPHVRWTGAQADFYHAHNWHAKFQVIGYHNRRLTLRGHKIFRMNGYQRRVMGATWHALTEGYYPDWDPLQRFPQPVDIDNGADFVDIEWRWGVTGVYP